MLRMEKKSLECNNLFIERNGRIILHHFNMSLNGSKCILGESGSGKTLLLKEIKKLAKGVTLLGSMDVYLGEEADGNWQEELVFVQQPKVVQKFLKIFFRDCKYQAKKLALLKKVFNRPDFLLIDDLTDFFSDVEKKVLFHFLEQLSIKVCYVTRNIEDVVYFPYFIILKNKGIAMEGKTELVLKEEKLIKLLGFSLPFYVNLSLQLQLYEVIDDICYSKEELEALLWPLN